MIILLNVRKVFGENMKSVKYLGFVGLGCAALLLTGCGGESSNSGSGSDKDKTPVKHVLTCSMSEGTDVLNVEIEFNDKEDKVVGAKMNMSTKIPEGATDENIEEVKDYIDETMCVSDLENCKSFVSGDTIKFEASFTADSLKDEDFEGNKNEVKEKLEDGGYTCK